MPDGGGARGECAALSLQSRHQSDSGMRFECMANDFLWTIASQSSDREDHMNDTVLALLSALAIYGLANFALPRGGWDTADDDTIIQLGETPEASPADESRDDGPQTG
jgi:hypothetical protein